MALPRFTMRELLEAGVHFGHQTHLWNPKMKPYIFGTRNNIHIIDLSQTMPLLYEALCATREVVANKGRVLYVGTKRQAQEEMRLCAQKSGHYYINHRWLGGTLTNWSAISNSIKRLHALDELLGSEEAEKLTKKERLNRTRMRDKLEQTLGGIRDMGELPDLLVVIDTNREIIAVHEAHKLGIPIVGILDSNSDPDYIDYPVPGNDDSARAIGLYCDLFSKAALEGLVGASEDEAVISEEPKAS